MERVGGRLEKMEGHCSTGQSPQWAVVTVEEEEEEEEEKEAYLISQKHPLSTVLRFYIWFVNN